MAHPKDRVYVCGLVTWERGRVLLTRQVRRRRLSSRDRSTTRAGPHYSYIRTAEKASIHSDGARTVSRNDARTHCEFRECLSLSGRYVGSSPLVRTLMLLTQRWPKVQCLPSSKRSIHSHNCRYVSLSNVYRTM
jgi:hypothetical protein